MRLDVARRLDDDRHAARRRVTEQLAERLRRRSDRCRCWCDGRGRSRTDPSSRWRGSSSSRPRPTTRTSAFSSRRARRPAADEVVSRGERMTRVETDAESRVPLQRVEQRREIADRRREWSAAAGGRLDQQLRVIVVELVEDRQQLLVASASRRRRDAPASTAEPACTTTPRAPIRAPRLQRVADRRCCLAPASPRSASRSSQVRRMHEDRHAAVDAVEPRTPRHRRVAGGRGPSARVGDEDLHGLGTDALGVAEARRRTSRPPTNTWAPTGGRLARRHARVSRGTTSSRRWCGD